MTDDIQRSAIRRSPGSVNFVTALAYHFCLALSAAFAQPGDHLLVESSTLRKIIIYYERNYNAINLWIKKTSP